MCSKNLEILFQALTSLNVFKIQTLKICFCEKLCFFGFSSATIFALISTKNHVILDFAKRSVQVYGGNQSQILTSRLKIEIIGVRINVSVKKGKFRLIFCCVRLKYIFMPHFDHLIFSNHYPRIFQKFGF